MKRTVIGFVVLAGLGCGGLGTTVTDVLLAEGYAEVLSVEEGADGGSRWAAVRPDAWCTGSSTPGPGVGPIRGAPTLVDLSCDPRGSAREFAWICEHRDAPLPCRDAGVLLQRAGDPAALPLFERACSLGEGAGCRFAGMAYHKGTLGVAVDEAGAAEWFDKGCNLSDDRACLERGRQRATDPDRWGCGSDADQWWRRGGAESKTAIAEANAHCPDGDRAAARKLWEEACREGSTAACRGHGYALVEGVGGPVDLAGAVAVFRRGCRAEPQDLQACIEFGLTLVATGDPQGGPRALAAFHEACDGGLAVGCRDVGVMLRDGQLGVHADGSEARTAFQKGCDGGDEPSCREIGAD